MILRFPVRRFIQSTEKTQAPNSRFGSIQWVLARPLYRFHVIDLAQVPQKSRTQALRLELSQWTPYRTPGYYIGWNGPQALVWAWDAEKVTAAIIAQNLRRSNAEVIPETLLHCPLLNGCCVTRCTEGFEGQLWRDGVLQNSRWWPQPPNVQEWLLFQRDAGLSPDEQVNEPPAQRDRSLSQQPWLAASGLQDMSLTGERVLYAALSLALLSPTAWYGAQWYKAQNAVSHIAAQVQQLRVDANPIAQARSQALDHLSRINALSKISPYPDQLALMAEVAQALAQDKSVLKDWDFQSGQLKFTLMSTSDISTTNTIHLLQQAGPFLDVKAMPGRDPKVVTFQMNVASSSSTKPS